MGQRVCGHCKGRLNILGIGPGDMGFLNQRAYQAILECQVIVGYRTYIKLLKDWVADKEIISSGMTQERRRARQAINKSLEGKNVCVISSGDPGIYGMAGVILELLRKEEEKQISIEVIPGITAASSCASLLGAPLMNDFAVISLSDLLTHRKLIEERVELACQGDFVIVFYNPKSTKRVKPLERAWEILMRHKLPQTPVGVVRNAQREKEEVIITSLKDMLSLKQIDMGTTIIVGNSKTYVRGKYMITPRGYEYKQRGKPMRYYPVNLNIKGKLCVVIGGGKVAERKIRNILLYGGKVKVIGPELTEPLSQMLRRRGINYRQGEYHAGVLEGAFLAYAATSDRKVNAQVAKDATRLGILVNVCDSAGESTFILPAVLRKKGVTIAVSTDGLSPAKSVRIRDRLKELSEEGILAKTKE